MTGIYKLTNLKNGKVYIGQSSDIKQRWEHYKSLDRKSCNDYFYKALKKYGPKGFSFEVLKEFKPDTPNLKEFLDLYETTYIQVYDSTNRTLGYNFQSGGGVSRGWHHSEETRKRISQRKREEMNDSTRDKIRIAKTGTRACADTKRRISESMKAKPSAFHEACAKARWKGVRCIESQIVFESLTEAGDSIGKPRCYISLVLTGKLKTAGGFHWEYA